MRDLQSPLSIRRLARAARAMEVAEFQSSLGDPLAMLVGPFKLDRSSVSLTLGQPDPQIQLLSPADFDRFAAIVVPNRDDEIVLGRGEDADVYLADSSISKAHASVHRLANGRMVLTDLRSRNGTFVRGAIVARGTAVYLKTGDKLQLGSQALKFYDPSALYLTLRRLILIP